jgi:hypothetical protein
MNSARLAKFGLVAALSSFAAMSSAYCADECFQPPARVGSLSHVSAPFLLQTGRAIYVVRSTCHTVSRRIFGSTLSFALLNRFRTDTAVTEAFVFVKSSRIFSTSPPIKISLSRGDGWFVESGASRQVGSAPRIAFEPFVDSIEKWNEAHATPGSPIELASKLKVNWHAYASRAPAMPSTVPVEFWKIEDTFNRAHGVRTNYLLRFDVNTTAEGSVVPFQVYIQPEVLEVEITMLSNIDAFSGTFRFLIR